MIVVTISVRVVHDSTAVAGRVLMRWSMVGRAAGSGDAGRIASVSPRGSPRRPVPSPAHHGRDEKPGVKDRSPGSGSSRSFGPSRFAVTATVSLLLVNDRRGIAIGAMILA